MMKKYKHGIAVMRMQPLHFGHIRIINQMINDCEHTTILIGSSQDQYTHKNPFTLFERRRMLKNVFSSEVNIIHINDIGMPHIWREYVLGKVVDTYPNLLVPDAYYAGSDENSRYLNGGCMQIEVCGRDDLSATKVRDMISSGSNEWKKYVPEINHPIVERFIERGKKK